MEIDQDMIKKYGWHLKVVGAYVQNPRPSIVGLDDRSIIGSNDAASLYPISGAHQNLGYDTIRDRIYDASIVKRILGLLETVFRERGSNPNIQKQAVGGFTNAIGNSVKEYLTKHKGINKKEAFEFTVNYYPILLKRLLAYPGKLEDIFNPIDDRTYFLLKSCLFPLLETIFWLSPQNRGYNQLAVDYVLFHDVYLETKKDFYIFKEINSTKTTFQKMTFNEGQEWFKHRIINPYGVLYSLHQENLAYDVEITLDSLDNRSIVKNQMLVLSAILSQWNKIPEEKQQLFLKKDPNRDTLNESEANDILDIIQDVEDRTKRIQSLCQIKLPNSSEPQKFIILRISQLNVVQLGIKVSMNSGYGLFAMPTWVYSHSLIGNSFTCAGKIYGIKLFQFVSATILEDKKEEQGGIK